jgi:hypothetical protein
MTWQSALSHASVLPRAFSWPLAQEQQVGARLLVLLCLLLHRHLLQAGWTPVEYPVWKEGR